jgi:hypothetical protein
MLPRPPTYARSQARIDTYILPNGDATAGRRPKLGSDVANSQRLCRAIATPKMVGGVAIFQPKFAVFRESIVFEKSAQIVHFESSKRARYLASWKDARFRAKGEMRKNPL